MRLFDIRRPAKKFRNVVLPDPEGPRIAVKDSAGIIPLWGWRMILSGWFFIFAVIVI